MPMNAADSAKKLGLQGGSDQQSAGLLVASAGLRASAAMDMGMHNCTSVAKERRKPISCSPGLLAGRVSFHIALKGRIP